MHHPAPDQSESRANTGIPSPSNPAMTSAVSPISRAFQSPIEETPCVEGQADYRWIDRIIRQDGPGILRMLWRMLGREQDAMDAYQDCFCKLAARGRPGDPTKARAYAYRTASNVAIEILRKRKRRAAHLPAIAERQRAGQNSEQPADGDLDALRDAIARLPDHLRNVVVLRDLNRLPYEAVSKTLGITSATARVYRRHAVVKLAELLDQGETS